MRELLRPGATVLRRDADRLQVGLRRARVVLPDTAVVRDLLERLATGDEQPSDGSTAPTRARLRDAGLLMDAAAVTPVLGGSEPGSDSRDAAATALADGDTTGWARRGDLRVGVARVGGDATAGDVLVREAADLLVGAGIDAGALDNPPERDDRDPVAGAAVLVCVGEPDRESVDGWSRAGIPHLLVSVVEGDVLLGPFVHPGATACLRCLDLHVADRDPRWPLLVVQASRAAARPRADGLPTPVDRLQATAALAWAAREVASYAAGDPLLTWSATLRLAPRLAEAEVIRWPRHAACGCAWDAGVR